MATQLPQLNIRYWDHDDGSVSACLETYHDGDIWARNEQLLFAGINYLMQHLIEAEKRRKSNHAERGMFGGGMQAQWIEGELVVRWHPVPGFGVSFKSEQNLTAWLGELLKMALLAAKEA